MAKAREIEGLNCGAGEADGARLVLLTRLDEMCAYREAALDWSDPEGVHDMRVASRRLRSAMKDFSPYLRGRRLRRAGERVRTLARALGQVRDQDVAIAALEKLAAEAAAGISDGILGFAAARGRSREKARARLTEALAEESLARLGEGLRLALEDATVRKENAGAGRSFRQAGREVITARLEELRGMGESLYRPLKAGPLHRMRIVAKGLRYAVELFAACWGEPLAPFAKEIAGLQTSLGELHDCDVWIDEVGAALEEEDGDAGATRRAAAFWLLGHFVEERTRHFRDALGRWRDWEESGFRQRLASTLEQ